MRAGQMRFMVDVYAPTSVEGNDGQTTYTYAFYKRIYAGIVRDSMSKSEDGFIQMSGHEEVTLATRFDPNIGYNHRIEWNGTTYRITKVDNVMNLNHKLELSITAVDA